MAQKALKTLATRNTSALNRLHILSLSINLFFILLRLILFRASATRATITLYLLLIAPSLLIEFYFERSSRPSHTSANELKSPGADLEAKGLTEWMWDVVYWTWGCIVLAAVLGDKAWWAMVVVPCYSAWLGWVVVKGGMPGMPGMPGMGTGRQDDGGGEGQSKRQGKMEKRGGQRMNYR